MKQISEDTITSINKAIITGILAELVYLEIKDQSFQEVKLLIGRLGKAGRDLQRYFSTHPNCSHELRDKFKNEFLGGKNVLISEILTLLTNMTEDGVESVLTAIKTAIEQESPEENSEASLTLLNST